MPRQSATELSLAVLGPGLVAHGIIVPEEVPSTISAGSPGSALARAKVRNDTMKMAATMRPSFPATIFMWSPRRAGHEHLWWSSPQLGSSV